MSIQLISTKLPALCLGAVLACALAPTQAVESIKCNACSSTTDFINAAENQSAIEQHAGTFVISSASQASTSYIHLTGRFVLRNGETFWTITGAYPVDGVNNNIAGYTEPQLQSFYSALDITTMGAERGNANWVNTANSPVGLPRGFTLTTDQAVSDFINAQHVSYEGLPIDYILTINFPDGSVAQYQYVGNKQWVWNGIAFNSAGKRIHRDGTLVTYPQASSMARGGSFSVVGFGQFTGWNWNIIGGDTSNNCAFQTTITVNGQGTDYYNLSAC